MSIGNGSMRAARKNDLGPLWAKSCCEKKFGGFCGVGGLFGQCEMIIVLSWMFICCWRYDLGRYKFLRCCRSQPLLSRRKFAAFMWSNLLC